MQTESVAIEPEVSTATKEKLLKVLLWPHEGLSTPCDPIVDYKSVSELVPRMLKVMANLAGIGLTANQIGLPVQLIVLNKGALGDEEAFRDREHLAIVNPVLLGVGGDLLRVKEGCLSVPGLFIDLPRTQSALLEFTDASTGERITHKFSGLGSRAVQHEMEHLEGKFFLDHTDDKFRSSIEKQIKKLVRSRHYNELRKTYVAP